MSKVNKVNLAVIMLGTLTIMLAANDLFADVTVSLEQLSAYNGVNHYGTAIKRGTSNVPILRIIIAADPVVDATWVELRVTYIGTRIADIGSYARIYKGSVLIGERSISGGTAIFPLSQTITAGSGSHAYDVKLDVVSGAGSNYVDLMYDSATFVTTANVVEPAVKDPAGYAFVDASPPGLNVYVTHSRYYYGEYDRGTKILKLKFYDKLDPTTPDQRVTNPLVRLVWSEAADKPTQYMVALSKIILRARDDSPSIALIGATLLWPGTGILSGAILVAGDRFPDKGVSAFGSEVWIQLTSTQDASLQNDVLPDESTITEPDVPGSLVVEVYIGAGALSDAGPSVTEKGKDFGNMIGEHSNDIIVVGVDLTPPMLVDEMPVKFNYKAKVLSLSFTEVIDAVPASDVDLSKLKIKNATVGPIDLTGAVVTECYCSTATITLTDAQRDILKGDWPKLDIKAGAVKDVSGNPISDVLDVAVYVMPPPPVTVFAADNPTDTTIDLKWTNPLYAFFAGTLIVRSHNPITWQPTVGITYSIDEMVAPWVVVRYLGADGHSVTPFTDTGLSQITTYYYKAFTYDILYNYSDGVETSGKTLPTFPFGDVSGDKTVSAYDAALILRYVVGLIDHFPVEDMISPSFYTPINYTVKVQEQSAKVGDKIYVPVAINDIKGLVAGGISLRYDHTILKAIQVASLLNSAYWQANTDLTGEIRFAFASANPTEGQRNLLMVEFEALPNTEGKTSPLILDNVDLSNSLTITKINGSVTVLPTKSILLQNYPNPFNPDTWIPFKLATDSPVMLSIYNGKGQMIRTISLGTKQAGVYVTKDKAAYWDGKDQFGQAVSNGLYFYTLKAGDFHATKRMVIVK